MKCCYLKYFLFLCFFLHILKAEDSKLSIISDLQDAFMPFSALDSEYKKIKDYKKFLQSISTRKVYINSFETKDEDLARFKKLDYAKPPGTTTNISEPKPANIESKKPTPKYDIKDFQALSPKCYNKTFKLKKDQQIDPVQILSAIAKECDFSLQYIKHEGTKHDSYLHLLNLNDIVLPELIDVLLDDFFYEIKPHLLIIKDIDMRIFTLNYISSTRIAQSNTDVLFSQDNAYYGNGYYGGYYGNTYNNYNRQNVRVPQINTESNTQFGKSGTKIYSLDSTNFFSDIEQRLKGILDSNGKFIIDKSSGSISIWSNKEKMREVEKFLENLKDKINLQVSIDVEILSLLHFSSSNIGLDWQQIFSILNPTSSNYSLGSGMAVFNVANDSSDLNAIFSLLKTYGNLRSLSNPKIVALNNQPAIISVGSVLRYSQNLVFQSNNTNNTIQNTSTQYPSVFSGILLDITPSISDDYVILRINPSITRTKDPEIENSPQALTSPPNLSTSQLSSIVRLRNGQRVIIGGLLSNISQNNTQAIPGLGETKALKYLFGKNARIQRSEELIIIITPRIMDN